MNFGKIMGVITHVDQKCNNIPAQKGGIKDYISIARFDHITKHVFVLPGLLLAYILRGGEHFRPLFLLLGFIVVVSIASANYTINEFLDREFDKFHPVKSKRSAVQRELNGNIVFAEWFVLVVIGLFAAFCVSKVMLFVAIIFALQGVVYNVPPLRTKDKAYLDVISESINNPLRLCVGWEIVDSTTLPALSVICAYWAGGAFLMASKRYSEYREIVASHGKDLLVKYRASFEGYSERSLNISCFSYALFSVIFLSVFFVSYRPAFILPMLLTVFLFSYYLYLSFGTQSIAQNPEKTFKDPVIVVLSTAIFALFLVSYFWDISFVRIFTTQTYIHWS